MTAHSSILTWEVPWTVEPGRLPCMGSQRVGHDSTKLVEATSLSFSLYAKVRSQEIPGITGKFCLGVQNEAGQRLTEFYQENALVIANTLFNNTREDITCRVTRWSILKSD